MNFIINRKKHVFKLIKLFKNEDGLILRGGCAIAFMVVLAIGAFIGLIVGLTTDDWSIFFGCGGLLILNLIINAIIYGVNKGKENRYYEKYYNNYNTKLEKMVQKDIYKKDNFKETNIILNEETQDPITSNIDNRIDVEPIEEIEFKKDKTFQSNPELPSFKQDLNIFCPACGTQLPNNAMYCMKCGRNIK